MRDFVHHDSHAGCSADEGRSVEGAGHGETVGDIVCEVRDEVEDAGGLDGGGGGCSGCIILRLLAIAVLELAAGGGGVDAGGLLDRSGRSNRGVGVTVRVSTAVAAGDNAEGFVDSDKSDKADKNEQSEDPVAFAVVEDKVSARVVRFAKEDLGEEVQERVAEDAANGEGDHDGEGGGVDVGGAERKEEVGGAGDVGGREEGVDGGAAGEHDREGALHEPGGLVGRGEELMVEFLHEGTVLRLLVESRCGEQRMVPGAFGRSQRW